MDESTDSDASQDVLVRSESQDIHLRNIPAIVTWRDSDKQSQSLEHLEFVLVYKNDSQQALIRFQTGLKLRRDPAKPNIFLLIKPTDIDKLEYVRDEDDDLLQVEREQYRAARQKLRSSAYTLRFTLRTTAVFVVPKQQSYMAFRAGSQSIWRSWESFVKDTTQFLVHFPTNTLPKMRLLTFCQVATRSGLTSLNDEIASLYGGEGGRVIDPRARQYEHGPAAFNSHVVGDAPPAYDERLTAGPSLSAVKPQLCLSPQSESQPDRKRRRGESRSDAETEATSDRTKTFGDASDLILQSLAQLQRIVEVGRSEHGAILTEMLSQMKSMDSRISRLENQQNDLSKEIETYVEPLWDELSARLQSQEDREHDYMRDIAEEVFGEKMDERVDERMPEALDSYFRHGDDGQSLVSEVVSEKIQEETRDFLRRQCFTTQITLAENE